MKKRIVKIVVGAGPDGQHLIYYSNNTLLWIDPEKLEEYKKKMKNPVYWGFEWKEKDDKKNM